MSMLLHFHCPPISGNPTEAALTFTWNPDTGEVTGPGAGIVLELAVPGARIDLHPLPQGAPLGPDPLRSWRDLAVIVGSEWQLPYDLLPHYPQDPNARGGKVRDEDGNVVGDVTFQSD